MPVRDQGSSRLVQYAARPAALAALTLAVLTACPTVPQQTAVMQQVGGVSVGTAELRLRTSEFGRRFAGVMEMAADSITRA